MNTKLVNLLLLSLMANSFADTDINLNQQQLNEARATVKAEGSAAIARAPEAKTVLSSIKLSNLDLTDAKNEESKASASMYRASPLTTKLPNGQTYHLYSESIVSENQQYLAQYANGKPLDINKTISDYNAMVKNAKSQIADNRLLIFISSSLPKKTIINLMTQASAIGAVFVIRGLMNGSYVNTYKYFYQLKGENTVGIMINPTLFKAFDVQSVPTFALYKSSQDLMQTACKVAPVYTKVTGAVTVHYALEQLKTSKIADLSQIASNELDILDSSSFYKGHTQ